MFRGICSQWQLQDENIKMIPLSWTDLIEFRNKPHCHWVFARMQSEVLCNVICYYFVIAVEAEENRDIN